MHVGLVVYGSLDSVSGGNLYDRELVDTLRRASNQVEIVSLPLSSYARHLGHNLRRRTFEELRRAPFDVLLQDELVHPSLFLLNRRLRRTVTYPLVGIVHHLRSSEAWPRYQKPLYARIEAAYLRTLDAFVWNSHETRRVVQGVVRGRPPGVVAHPGKDRLRPAPRARQRPAAPRSPSGSLRILFVGNLIPRKGLHVLVAALARLPRRDFRLHVVGSPSVAPAYTRRVRRQVRRAGLEDRVTFQGSVPDGELCRHFQDAQLLAVPSSYEGFGIVYLEAMGFGVPVLATTAGAAKEVVRHGENGFLVPPEDPSAVEEHLRLLCGEGQLLETLSRGARATYDGHPTWGETTDTILRFLTRIVDGGVEAVT